MFLDLISKRGNVLLIYDSSDDLDIIKDVLPQSSTKVHVIVTTRCRDHTLMNEGHSISLPPLNEDAAVETLLSWAGKGMNISERERQAARDIVSDVQVKALPLTIRRVATYMKEARMTCSQLIPRLLEKQTLQCSSEGMEEILKSRGLQYLLDKLRENGILRPQQFLDTDLHSLQQSGQISCSEQQELKKIQERLQFDTTTTTIWDLDLEEVSRSENAMELLNFSSLMKSSAIPIDVLCEVSSRNNQEIELRRGFSLLSDGFSLISCDHDDGTCSMHALVQQSVVKRMEWLGSLSSHCARLVRSLNARIPQSVDAIRQSFSNRKVMSLLPHIYSLCRRILDSQCIDEDDT